MSERFVGFVAPNGDLYIDRPRGYVDPLVRYEKFLAAINKKLTAILTPTTDDTLPDLQ